MSLGGQLEGPPGDTPAPTSPTVRTSSHPSHHQPRGDSPPSSCLPEAAGKSPWHQGQARPRAHPAHYAYLILGDAHAGVSVTKEGDQRGSGGVLVVVIGRAVFVVQLDHPIVIGKLSIALSQVPSLVITKTSKRLSEEMLRPDTTALQCWGQTLEEGPDGQGG